MTRFQNEALEKLMGFSETPGQRLIDQQISVDPFNAVSNYNIFNVQNCHALGLGGVLPPGTLMIAGPRRCESLIRRIIDLGNNMLTLLAPDRINLGRSAYAEGLQLCGRGGVINFGDRIEDIVAVVFRWDFGAQQAAAITTDRALETAQAWIVPRVLPLIHLYRSAPPGMSEPFIPARSSWILNPIDSHTSSGLPTLFLPPDCQRVTVAFTDNAASTPVQAAETGDFDVAWGYGQSGTIMMYQHNPLDDFDAGGRLAVTAAHTGETYTRPAGALTVEVYQPITVAAFWAFLHLE